MITSLVFDGSGHEIIHPKETYEIIKTSKFEVGDDVTSPHTKFFDFGKIVYKRSTIKNDRVFWEYAVEINEAKRESVFFYPEPVLILLPKPKPVEEAPPKTEPKARRLVDSTAVAKIQERRSVIEDRIRYASAATFMILLYALL